MKTYRCRDCGRTFAPERPTNRCPFCGSLYILPLDLVPGISLRNNTVRLSERLLALLFGTFFGALTFVVWILAILLKAGSLPAAGLIKGMPFVFGTGIALALPMAVLFGGIGFVVGEARLARLFGIIWGTDRAFNMRLHETLSRKPEAPHGLLIMILSIIIVASFAYLLRVLR